MKKKCLSVSKKLIAVLLAVMISGVVAMPVSAAEEKNYIIDNPYADIDWDSWGSYKTQLHSHTNASDGFLTIHEYVKKHYDLDYDIVAVTDHGTINKGWNVAPDLVPIMRLIKYERSQMQPVTPLTEQEYEAYTSGSAYSETRTHENGMLDVPKGIELNMATPVADCHLTGYFSDYGQGLAGVFGDYETPSREVMKDGGITFMSHVGEFVYTDKDSADHVGQKVDDYYANKFARLFIDYQGSALGMGINSATDAHTRCDRIFYDQVLQKTIPNGVVPWCNTFADSHNEASINDAYTWTWMENFTMEDFRESLEKGQFFSVSHYSNGVELNGMEEMPGFDEQKVYDEKLYLLDNTPNVTRLEVDEDSDTIYVEGENFNLITWVSDGNVILREEITDGKASLDLHSENLLDNPDLYVRFYLSGENGICYSQPLVLNVEGEDFAPVNVPETNDISTFLRKLVTYIDKIFFEYNPIVWAFKYFALGYNPLERL